MTANYVLLEKITVGAAGASSVTFSGIPQTGYTDLVLKMSARCDSTSGFPEIVNMKFNSSATTDYTWKSLYSVTATPGSNGDTSVGVVRAGNAQAAATTANTFSNTEIYIPNYSGSTNKSISIDATNEANSSTDFVYGLFLNAGLRSNTAAITAINLSLGAGNFVANSTFYLYGVAKLGTTPAIVPYATGGDTIMTDGTYWYHTFISSGTFTPQKAITCDYLVVAGGGGGSGISSGGAYSGAGGGAGGLRSTVTATGGGGSLETALSLGTSAYTVTIGAGGAQWTNGNNSVFATITSTGGGGAAATGGSGGGALNFSPYNTPGSGTANQGYAGAASTGNTFSGGGGGAGGAGTARTGGAGVAVSISGSSVSYAGGGGGGWGGTATAGGGAGGAASTNQDGFPGTANTGGGGGGASVNNGDKLGGAGGSGIVIVRYLV
jgi:hypothetical protein